MSLKNKLPIPKRSAEDIYEITPEFLREQGIKLLLMDLDNTLWGGVVGDDGVEGIEIGHETPGGQVYSEFQAWLSEMRSRGVLLSVISKNDEENAHCSNTFEWCNVGIPPEKDNLQNLSYETDIPNWQYVYEKNSILYCTDIEELDPVIRGVVEPQGIKSMLHCAIMDQGVYRGFVGFDECTANCFWTQGQVTTLQSLAEMLAVFLVKQRTLDRLKRQMSQ